MGRWWPCDRENNTFQSMTQGHATAANRTASRVKHTEFACPNHGFERLFERHRAREVKLHIRGHVDVGQVHLVEQHSTLS